MFSKKYMPYALGLTALWVGYVIYKNIKQDKEIKSLQSDMSRIGGESLSFNAYEDGIIVPPDAKRFVRGYNSSKNATVAPSPIKIYE